MSNTSPTRRRLCALVPAAGRGTRLGVDAPKVFVPLLPDLTVWDAIHDKLQKVSERIVLVLSPDGQRYLEANRASFNADTFARTEITLQGEPVGMGDAIFGAADLWHEYDDLLVVWGDQFNLSLKTIMACRELHAAGTSPALTLPVVCSPKPYVEYVFDSDNRLTSIRQSREGDHCEPGGFSDIGVFLMTGGRALEQEWTRYVAGATIGAVTAEINFLPFLVHLSAVAGWPVNRYETNDPSEAIGINTPEDLVYARQLLQNKTDR